MHRLYVWFSKHEYWRAAALLALAILLFLSPGLLLPGYFAPADNIRNLELFKNGVVPHNFLLTDVFVQFLPWYKLSAELVRHGHFPLWNAYTGGGLPLFANMQSAVLFPLTWFFYIFPFKIALLATSFGKLFFVGLFTYLYLRAIKISPTVAMTGAIAFMFIGFNIVWLMYPLTNLIFLLPLGLWLIERYSVTRNNLYILWLSLGLAIAFFAGHPETIFHFSVILGLYIIFKLFRVSTWRTFVPDAIKFGLMGLLALGMSAVLLLPFLEYLRSSEALLHRSATNGFFIL